MIVIFKNIDNLKYSLIRGFDIPYMNIRIQQPKIKDIDIIGSTMYANYRFLFCAKKEHLKLNDELSELTKDCSFFETLFIRDIYMVENNLLDQGDSFIALLRVSLAFFLNTDISDTTVDAENKNIHVINKEKNNIIFTLNKSNFNEFSELIRLICNCDMLEFEKEPEYKMEHYDDPVIQKMLEESVKRYIEEEKQRKKENEITLADIIGAICINENTKYNFSNIEELTIWQLFYIFNSMLSKEGVDIVKLQFTSGNFKFDKPPDMNWLNKVKIKLPKIN